MDKSVYFFSLELAN